MKASSLFADSPSEWKIAVLVLFSIVALVIVSALLWRNSHSMSTTGVGLALILGGALGNLWDRLVSGRVVDFLLFVIGAGLLVFEILFSKSPAQEKSA